MLAYIHVMHWFVVASLRNKIMWGKPLHMHIATSMKFNFLVGYIIYLTSSNLPLSLPVLIACWSPLSIILVCACTDSLGPCINYISFLQCMYVISLFSVYLNVITCTIVWLYFAEKPQSRTSHVLQHSYYRVSYGVTYSLVYLWV
jgi:hypothetical protein